MRTFSTPSPLAVQILLSFPSLTICHPLMHNYPRSSLLSPSASTARKIGAWTGISIAIIIVLMFIFYLGMRRERTGSWYCWRPDYSMPPLRATRNTGSGGPQPALPGTPTPCQRRTRRKTRRRRRGSEIDRTWTERQMARLDDEFEKQMEEARAQEQQEHQWGVQEVPGDSRRSSANITALPLPPTANYWPALHPALQIHHPPTPAPAPVPIPIPPVLQAPSPISRGRSTVPVPLPLQIPLPTHAVELPAEPPSTRPSPPRRAATELPVETPVYEIGGPRSVVESSSRSRSLHEMDGEEEEWRSDLEAEIIEEERRQLELERELEQQLGGIQIQEQDDAEMEGEYEEDKEYEEGEVYEEGDVDGQEEAAGEEQEREEEDEAVEHEREQERKHQQEDEPIPLPPRYPPSVLSSGRASAVVGSTSAAAGSTNASVRSGAASAAGSGTGSATPDSMNWEGLEWIKRVYKERGSRFPRLSWRSSKSSEVRTGGARER